MATYIHGGATLIAAQFERADLVASPEGLRLAGGQTEAHLGFDAQGLFVLPGMVDIHGDAFERQIMPRPGVSFDLGLALADTDRQLISNGITTACHAVTFSWEPGLRSVESAEAIINAVEAARMSLMADAHIHLRYETFNLDGEDVAGDWMREGRVRVLAFNNHMEGIVKAATGKQAKLGKMVERSGLSEAEFISLVERYWSRRDEVDASVERLAHVGRVTGIPMMSHDDRSPEERDMFRLLGCSIAEFPTTEATAVHAVEYGEATVFGAPNVVRGGSHTGCPTASEMVDKGLATILASDYYYPAMAQAPHRLQQAGIRPLAEAWALVSSAPAHHLGFTDRGVIADGKRADLVLAALEPSGLRLVATFACGQLMFCTEPERLSAL